MRGHHDIECFHSRGQHLCKFIGTKESVCIRKEFNSHRIGLGHQHGRRFIVLGHQYGRRDVMWKHSTNYMAFCYGQNYQTVHTYNEIQHIDIEPYKYTWQLQIYILNPHSYHSKLHIWTSYRMHVYRTAYIYIKVTYLYIETNTYTSKLNIYTSNQIHTCRNYTYINGTVQINRNAFVHVEIIRFYFELFACARRACLYEVFNHENF